MSWVGDLLAKLPTFKGIANFFYIATHWSEISQMLEEYRKQIRDRDDWLKQQAEHHEYEKARLTQETMGEIQRAQEVAQQGISVAREAIQELKLASAEAAKRGEQLQHTQGALQLLGRDLVDSTWLIALLLSTEDGTTRERLLGTLDPTARALIEDHAKRLPPPPPLPSLADFRPSSDMAHVELAPPPRSLATTYAHPPLPPRIPRPPGA